MVNEKTERWALVVIGLGHMGQIGVKSFIELLTNVEARRVDGEILCVFDVKSEPCLEAEQLCLDKLGYSPKIFVGDESGLISYLEAFLERDRSSLLIYDATPAPFREFYFHLIEAFAHSYPERAIRYLGEKPLFVDPHDLVRAQRLVNTFSFYCDFLESANPVFHTLRWYLKESGDSLNEMTFWRANTSGLRALLDDGDRLGVRGGALLDKLPHDISTSLNLLSCREESAEIVDIVFHTLLEKVTDSTDRQFLDCSGDFHDLVLNLEERHRLPADGSCSFSIKWGASAGKQVTAYYVGGWEGLTDAPCEQGVRNRLTELGYTEAEYSLRGAGTPAIEEVRIGIFECGECTIVCNFLTKKLPSGEFILRFANLHPRKAPTERKSLTLLTVDGSRASTANDDLASVFWAVISGESDQLYSQAVTIDTHRLLFRLQDLAIEKVTKLRAQDTPIVVDAVR